MSTEGSPDTGDDTSAGQLTRVGVLLAAGDGAGALTLCDALLPRYERVAAVHIARTGALGLLGRRSEACIAATRAIDCDPQSVVAWVTLADAMLAADKPGAAQSAYAQALAHGGDDATLWAHLGTALRRQGFADRARTALDRAVQLDPACVPARRARAELRAWTGDVEGGLEDAHLAVALAGDDPSVHAALATVLRRAGRGGEAAIAHERAATLAPADLQLQRARGSALLAGGRLREGFLALQQHGGVAHVGPLPLVPPWRGEALDGRTIAISTPTGRAETLLLLRFAGELARRGARVVLRSDPSLLPLLRGAVGVAALEGAADNNVAADLQAPLASVPALLAVSDEADLARNIPCLEPEPGRHGLWRAVLMSAELTVAIAHTVEGDPGVSPGLASFAALATAPDVRLLSLQPVGDPAPRGLRIEDLSARLDVAGPLVDTAAVLLSVDLAIVPDGPLAHLAGALGVPVWVMLSTEAHWCWQTGRDDSPWYPSARLLRQRTPGAWEPVFAEAARSLGRMVWNRRQR